MSDLAPFVASVLHDKVLAETKQELEDLSEQLQKSRVVQINGENGTVYAEAQFQDGSYRGNPNLWLVNFTELQLASCPLSDLPNVQICIGGICKAHFGDNSIVEGIIEQGEESTYIDGWGYINFCFGGTGQCWLSVKVGPFPSEEAFFAQVEEDIEAEDMASFLAHNVAVNHPELSITFEHTAFFVSAVKGAIQNLNLDPAIEEEAHRRREEWDEHIQQLNAAMAENGVDDGTDIEGDGEG
jgi:hypothetical protein